jgi:hypothetical protein
VSEDRRTSPRRVLDSAAKIIGDQTMGPFQCTIVDISNSGVRLAVRRDVPDEFSLILNDATGVRHKCRVVWRRDHQIGAKFLGLDAP